MHFRMMAGDVTPIWRARSGAWRPFRVSRALGWWSSCSPRCRSWGSEGFAFDFPGPTTQAARRIAAGDHLYLVDTVERYNSGLYAGLYLYPPQMAESRSYRSRCSPRPRGGRRPGLWFPAPGPWRSAVPSWPVASWVPTGPPSGWRRSASRVPVRPEPRQCPARGGLPCCRSWSGDSGRDRRPGPVPRRPSIAIPLSVPVRSAIRLAGDCAAGGCSRLDDGHPGSPCSHSRLPIVRVSADTSTT